LPCTGPGSTPDEPVTSPRPARDPLVRPRRANPLLGLGRSGWPRGNRSVGAAGRSEPWCRAARVCVPRVGRASIVVPSASWWDWCLADLGQITRPDRRPAPCLRFCTVR